MIKRKGCPSTKKKKKKVVQRRLLQNSCIDIIFLCYIKYKVFFYLKEYYVESWSSKNLKLLSIHLKWFEILRDGKKKCNF